MPAALAEALRGDVSAPFVTWIGADGSRTELSLRTYENNIAKAANLLRDDGDVGPGGFVSVHLPLHWQTAVWLGATALVGGTVDLDGDPRRAEVSVVGPDTLDLPIAPLTIASSLHPFGMPFARSQPLPSGVHDAADEVRSHGDRFTPYGDVTPATPWLSVGGRHWSQSQALEDSLELAASLGMTHGGRLLVVGTQVDARAVLALVALPLMMLGSVVLLNDASSSTDVRTSERCDAVLEIA